MRVHTCIKKLSAALAVTMALSLAAGLPAMAEDNGSSAPSSSASAPASAASNAPKTGDSAAAGSGGSSSSTAPTPTPAPDYSGEAPYVANYTLKNAAGNIGNLVRDKNNDVIPTGTLTVTVVDKRLQGVSALGGKPITQDQVRLIPQNGVTFSAQEGSVSNIKSDSYDVTFVGLQYLGGENTFTFDISYSSDFQLPVTSVSVTLPQCYTIEKTGSAEGTQLRAPGLIVKEFGYGGNSVPAGQPFTLNVTLFATSGEQNLSDVTVTLGLPENVSMANGNSSVYVGSMTPESSKELSFEILPSANLTGGVAALQLTMSGVGASDGTKSDGSATITVPVVQPERFEITKVEGTETLMVGEEGYLEVTFVNKGKEPISNLSAEISGENLRNPGQSQYLGNVQPGTENSAEFTISSDVEGTISGLITLTYENSAGETKTLTKEYSCTVQPAMDMGGMDMGMEMPVEPMPEENAGLPVWAWIVIVVAAVAVVAVVVVIVVKKRKAKKLAMLEAEDDDEDI